MSSWHTPSQYSKGGMLLTGLSIAPRSTLSPQQEKTLEACLKSNLKEAVSQLRILSLRWLCQRDINLANTVVGNLPEWNRKWFLTEHLLFHVAGPAYSFSGHAVKKSLLIWKPPSWSGQSAVLCWEMVSVLELTTPSRGERHSQWWLCHTLRWLQSQKSKT